MLKPEILEYICQNQLYEYCSFVTDDTMADVLYEQGPLNAVVQKAMEMGFPVEQAIYCATYTPCQRMHFYDRGAIAPGKLADFMLLENPSLLKPEAVFKTVFRFMRRMSSNCRLLFSDMNFRQIFTGVYRSRKFFQRIFR